MSNEALTIWKKWADKLKAWKSLDITADLLEVVGPLNLIAAQLVYLGQPILSSIVPNNELMVLANLLEEPAQTQDFVDFLREENA